MEIVPDLRYFCLESLKLFPLPIAAPILLKRWLFDLSFSKLPICLITFSISDEFIQLLCDFFSCVIAILSCGCSPETKTDLPAEDAILDTVSTPIEKSTDDSVDSTEGQRSEEQAEPGQPIEDRLPTAEEEYPKVEFTVTASELISEYKEDRSWRNKYNYKPCELTSTVVGYKSSFIQGHSGFSILLEDSGDGIAVTLNEEVPWTRYLPGATITVRGKTKSSGGLEVSSEIVVSATAGTDLPALTTEDLLQATETDRFPDTPGLRLAGDWMLFSTTVLKRDTNTKKQVFCTWAQKHNPWRDLDSWRIEWELRSSPMPRTPPVMRSLFCAVPRPVRRGVHCIACISDRSSSETPTPSVSRIQNECRWTAL